LVGHYFAIDCHLLKVTRFGEIPSSIVFKLIRPELAIQIFILQAIQLLVQFGEFGRIRNVLTSDT
jgi:hypothetical protein